MSPEARTALAWMRDTPHYAARWLIGRKVPTTQSPQEWTHIELIGDKVRHRMHKTVWAETAPYRQTAFDDARMWAPNDLGVEFLTQGATI